MSATAEPQGNATALSQKQRRILEFLSERADEQTYFKSRCIGDELGLSAKEVGTNMRAIQEGEFPIEVEKWGYSSSTTWMVSET
jgi:biotin operon repressor